MKYFFVSDIHGEYDKLLEALAKADFNMETDTLISLGDPFDRGPQSKKVLQYLINLPHKILVWGNHDLRLQTLIRGRDAPDWCDYSNGVPATLQDFTGQAPIENLEDLLYMCNYNMSCRDVMGDLGKYFRTCVYAVEFKDLIACHGWLPYRETYEASYTGPMKKIILRENWREEKSKIVWEDATWANTELCITSEAFPDKDMIIGHWHAWRIAEKFGEKRMELPVGKKLSTKTPINCSTYIFQTIKNTKVILIDGCTNIDSGQINVYIYESDEEPILYTLVNK